MDAHSREPHPSTPALKTLEKSLLALREFPERPDTFVDYRAISDSLHRLEKVGFDTREHRSQITPELMIAVVRATFTTYVGKLETVLRDFAEKSGVEQTRIANSTPNILGHIHSLESVAARFNVKVSDLYPINYDHQEGQFRELLDKREHSFGTRPFVSPLVPLMTIAFPAGEMSALRMPSRDLRGIRSPWRGA